MTNKELKEYLDKLDRKLERVNESLIKLEAKVETKEKEESKSIKTMMWLIALFVGGVSSLVSWLLK